VKANKPCFFAAAADYRLGAQLLLAHREGPCLLLRASCGGLLVKGVARYILCPRGDHSLVLGPPRQMRRSRRPEGV
jgi:hypothetical protein